MARIKKESGQSIVEVLIAFVIIVVILLALVRITVSSIRNANFSKNEAIATQHSQELIEEARDLREQNSETFFVEDGPCGKTDEISIFRRSRTCILDGDTMTVDVVVSWTDGSGIHQSELSTYLTDWK